MADFDPPFGSDADRRLPTSTEKQLGFGCGPADLSLFVGLWHQMQAEMNAIHAEAGIAGDDSTSRTTVDAILALISAATGGNPAGYVLMDVARARLPIYPEVLNTDGRIIVTSPSAGTIRIPGGVEFLHRGIFTVTTAQADFATAASKIYHLRWNPTDGFALKETGDPIYNPGALAETDSAFDSDYDDMLIARVVTNSSNVATITNLANKAILSNYLIWSGPMTTSAGVNGALRTFSSIFNWARTPRLATSLLRLEYGQEAAIDFDFRLHPLTEQIGIGGGDFVGGSDYLHRYGTSCVVVVDNAISVAVGVDVRG